VSDLILRTATRAQVELHDAPRALASGARRSLARLRREQTGQDMIEYAGVLLVVAIIIAAVVGSPIGSIISNGVTSLVSDVLGGTPPKHS
jgi:Flp pilus assembly pilin Flp